MKPVLKQFGSLTKTDFEQYPVWVNVHVVDYAEAWYDETDEETFRPWTGQLPVDPSNGMFLVRSQIVLIDGTSYPGFITPVEGSGEVTDSELGEAQPYLFAQNGSLITFWGGLFGFTNEAKKKTYDLFGRTADKVFPIRFQAEKGLTEGKQAGTIRGFYKMTDFLNHQIEITI